LHNQQYYVIIGGMPAPLESSFVYFGNVPDRFVAGEHDRLGNVVAIPPDQLPAFMETAAPATMEAWYELHSSPTAARLGRLATSYLVSGKATEVTNPARNIMAATQSLIDGLPDDFRLDFPGDDQQVPLRLQKTCEGDLLLGLPQAAEGSLGTDSTAMLYALFGADGALKDYSDIYVYPFEANGQRIDTMRPTYLRDRARQAQGLAFWMDYLPTIAQLIEANRDGNQKLVQQQLDTLSVTLRSRESANTPFGDMSIPDFLRSLSEEQREDLTMYGHLPDGFIPSSLPRECILEEMRFVSVEAIADALERWGIPYTEVSYTAGVRTVNEANLTWAMADGQIPGSFDRAYNLLPETFSRLGDRRQNDIYARIGVNESDGDPLEREILLYDGCNYVPEVDRYSTEQMPILSIPQEVRSHVAQADSRHDLRRTEVRSTMQTIRSDAISVYVKGEGLTRDGKFVVDRPASAQDEVRVVLDGQSLPLTPAMSARLNQGQVVGVGPYSRDRQELTISYRRIGDALVPMVENVRSVIERHEAREPETYKR
jgi:hypothetical protein